MNEWFNLIARWSHLIAGISWIGSSFYFIWLDSALERPASRANQDPIFSNPDVEGYLWMVHSGGFYQVIRKKIGPGRMPLVLHWFKYEALLTWVTGIFLLGIVYFGTGAALLIDPQILPLTQVQALGLSVAFLAGSWIVYDLLWVKLGKTQPRIAQVICCVGGVALAKVLCGVYSGRGAFIHFGAILGTIMVANVWIRILPNQQKMIDATAEGREPNPEDSKSAKTRSVHNSYLTFPVLFMMLSNHFSLLYSGSFNWVVLLLLSTFGGCVRHAMIAKNPEGKSVGIWALVPGVAALIMAVGLSSGGFLSASHSPLKVEQTYSHLGNVGFSRVRAIVQARCVACHSAHPADPTYGPNPAGVNFEDPTRLHALAERVRLRVVQTRTMPPANKTGVTDEERALFGRWLELGARLED